MNDLISVIIPVYNIELYLERCITSIVNQTYQNLEIIAVNDGSTDGSLQVLQTLAKKDSRIKVIDKVNQGVAIARNTGLDYALGRYIVFVDGDDYIEPSMIQCLATLMENYKVDLSLCKISESGSVIEDKVYPIRQYNHHQLMEGIFKDQEISSHPVNKLYRKEIFDQLRFPSGTIVEDMALAHELMQKVNSAVLTEAPLYIYDTTRMTSTSNSKAKSIPASYDRAKVMVNRYALANAKYPDLKEIIVPQMVNFLLSSYAKMLPEKDKYAKDLIWIFDILNSNKECILMSPHVDKIYKLIVKAILDNQRFIINLSCWGYRFLLYMKYK